MSKLGALLIYTHRFSEMRTYYEDVVGATIKDSDPGAGYKVGVDAIAYETGECMLELFDAGVHGHQLGALAPTEGSVIATALNVGDVNEWLARNAGTVTPLGPVRKVDWGTFTFVADPEGNPIQVFHE